MSFYDLYNTVNESREDFYVGKNHVHLSEVGDYTEATAITKKWRATYNVNGKPITTYVTAVNKHEAKKMLYDFLRVPDGAKQEIVRSSEFAPVENWNELIRLLQYSMGNDRKNRRNDAQPFGSLTASDYHLMLLLVKRHPDFVKTHLASLEPKLQFYFKSVYNGLSKRDLDQDLDPHWGQQVKGVLDQHGEEIGDRMAPLKTRNSPKPDMVSAIPNPGTLGLGDDAPPEVRKTP